MKKNCTNRELFITFCDDGVEILQEKIIMALEKVAFFYINS